MSDPQYLGFADPVDFALYRTGLIDEAELLRRLHKSVDPRCYGDVGEMVPLAELRTAE